MTETLQIETIVNGPFMENCFLVWNPANQKGVFIDPGDEAEKLIRIAKQHNVEIEAILNTHGHIDHAGAVQPIKEKLGVPFAMHAADQPILDSLPGQAAMFGVGHVEIPSIDTALREGDKVEIGGIPGKVLHTPGHTPGGICFLFDDAVFVGDTLFAGSVGRTDLPGGSTKQLLSAIKNKLLTQDDSLKVYSGHGPVTTIGAERQHNPFLNEAMW